MPDKRKLQQQRAQKAPRWLFLKFRVTPLVRMPKSVLFIKLRQACRDGIIPRDIEIATLQWDHGQGKRYLAGTVLDAGDAKELMKCYNVLAGVEKSGVRFERP